jgi:DNA polymerase-3 subunit delta
LLAENLGNDLLRIANEIGKLKLMLAEHAEITPEIIEKWIGISKEYNVTEFNKAIIQHDFSKAIKIVMYFDKNPKAGNAIQIIAFLFQYFSRLFVYHYNRNKSDGELKSIGLYYLNDYRSGAKYYSLAKTEKIIAILNEYDAKAKGLYATNNMSNGDLLKELTFKILN